MTQHDPENKLASATVYGRDQEKIGTVERVHPGRDDDGAQYVSVRTGGPSSAAHGLPLQNARIEDGELFVPYTKRDVDGAPETGQDELLDAETMRRIADHYGVRGDAKGDA